MNDDDYTYMFCRFIITFVETNIVVVPTKRSIISYSFILLFVFLQGLPLVFNICIQQHYVARSFENKPQVTLQFSTKEWSNIHSVKKNEVVINGKMFDFNTIKTVGDVVQITGHFDGKEDDLIQLEKESKRKGMALEEPLSFFAFLFFEEYEKFDFFKQYDTQKYYTVLTDQLLDSYIITDLPPPKFA